ncbi:hypothetical protein CAPTEDRAFT_18044 [Capitella teleta]|uniref:AP-3 complex subunit delta domain-containing protein n=1 Tax=Capitella teleta TaxID=283909 RepID=R7T6K8_CAPTE|nr:hypothetical protein CAPTEDRAFT_18044 [Capitella teleta]|eukprot:ELT88988.1 hypothetical protein CAPTEDRAFT_18044 [Capitella teleta]
MALKKVKGSLERVLDKNLQDLVRGIRNHKETEAKYIAECIDEIKSELRQDNMAVKANAVNKLTYLQMIGYDVSWAAFNVIEVMSCSKFTYKRIGYLGAAQSFHDGTDVLMLTTNMIRKDLGSNNMYDAGVALGGLSCFLTADLARDLANDIMTLMTSTKPYLRKKAVLIMYKVFLCFPEALRPAFPRLKEKLEDPDPGVQSAAVNVICELARKNPKNYLSLAPLFFKLMTSSTNNWVLIKIIKLFGALTPLEPRLGKKLIEPLTNLIHSTSAMSLLYECINTVIAVLISISSGIPNHNASIQLCVQKLRILIEDSDQNLKYLGLLAMSKILKTHPKSVQSHKDLILQCLDDKDESIRLRALNLLYGMVSKKNLMEIVKKLMVHMDKAEGSYYRDELLCKTIEICSQSNYQFITNFEWYVSILVELTRIEGTRHGKLIASQMLDVAIRVQAIRPFAVSQMAILLENSHLLANNSQRNGICEVLYAAAWICGEFSEHLRDPQGTLEAMLRSKVTQLPGHIQSIYVQNIVKLYSRVLSQAESESDPETINETSALLLEKLPMFVQSADLEVQERACCVLQLMKYIQKLQDKGGCSVAQEVASLFAGDLNPVAPKAQRKVPVPEGLDLDQWINEPLSESSDEEMTSANIFVPTGDDHRPVYENSKPAYEPTEGELDRMREVREQEQLNNPHYLKPSEKSSKRHSRASNGDSYNDIPVSEIDLAVPLHVPGLQSSDKYLQAHRAQEKQRGSSKATRKMKRKRKKKGRHAASTEEEEEEEEEEAIAVAHQVSMAIDLPDGASLSDQEGGGAGGSQDPHKLLDINLDEPLRDDEILPVRTHRIVDGIVGLPDEEKTGEGAPEKKHRKHRKRHDSQHKKEKKRTKDKKEKSEYPREDVQEEEEEGEEKQEAAQRLPLNHAPTPAAYKLPPMASYQTLGENTDLRLMYELRVDAMQSKRVVASIVFVNLTSNQVKDLELNVLDSLNTKLQRGMGACSHDPVSVPFQLPPLAQNEGQFAFSVDAISVPQRMKGTLTYIIKSDQGSSQEKLDFKLPLSCSTFLVGLPCNGDAYAKLLSSGDLADKHSAQCRAVDSDLSKILAKICFYAHFSIVEQVESSASLYSRSIQGHHICLLVKQCADDTLSIDGKSSNASLLSNVVSDIEAILSRTQ